MSGITNPYKLYRHIHPSDVGMNHCGEKEVQSDILQEIFINTTTGWINLLMSPSKPVKIPVSACATAFQSLKIACDIIISNKAKVMIAGGFDDISEEDSYKFANTKAMSNVETELTMGHEHTEMSRPTTTTHAGQSPLLLPPQLTHGIGTPYLLQFNAIPLDFQGLHTTQQRPLNGVYHIIPTAAIVEKVGILQMQAV
ncbi:hypothetical protein F5141DRAFT_1222949 [Pisolithus sp. B1]|nr:hypothetical protein F5141DRAFT_1222949 [Pisolithus sp. B1]